jgi:AraC-like DNA-binding protein/mannose-6-phosphate isomerase-like protein (cupin superfamily)
MRQSDFRTVDAERHRENLSRIDAAPEPLYALRRIYEPGVRTLLHSHRKTQLWHARRGVVVVSTRDRRWMIPPGHGLIIPAGVEHSSETISEVEMQSVYADASLAPADRPRVVNVTALAANLISELVRDDLASRRRALVTDLLIDEIQHLPDVPLGLPFPADERLAESCRAFLRAPSAVAGIDDWATTLAMSRRSFTRFFRAQTGISFVTWRQQACLFASLPRLAEGHSITSVALDAGYENIAAFTTMFRRMLGTPPRAYLMAQQ